MGATAFVLSENNVNGTVLDNKVVCTVNNAAGCGVLIRTGQPTFLVGHRTDCVYSDNNPPI